MYPFVFPDYEKSIVNLMSSITKNYGKKHSYKQLDSLKAKDLKKYKNIVLIVIDGLGYNFLKKQKDSFLNKNIKDKISSTFLSTTACANGVFFNRLSSTTNCINRLGHKPKRNWFNNNNLKIHPLLQRRRTI